MARPILGLPRCLRRARPTRRWCRRFDRADAQHCGAPMQASGQNLLAESHDEGCTSTSTETRGAAGRYSRTRRGRFQSGQDRGEGPCSPGSILPRLPRPCDAHVERKLPRAHHWLLQLLLVLLVTAVTIVALQAREDPPRYAFEYSLPVPPKPPPPRPGSRRPPAALPPREGQRPAASSRADWFETSAPIATGQRKDD